MFVSHWVGILDCISISVNRCESGFFRIFCPALNNSFVILSSPGAFFVFRSSMAFSISSSRKLIFSRICSVSLSILLYSSLLSSSSFLGSVLSSLLYVFSKNFVIDFTIFHSIRYCYSIFIFNFLDPWFSVIANFFFD